MRTMARSSSLTRVYVPDTIPAHGVFEAPPHAAHHLAHVLRLAPGDVLVVFDGRGLEYPATIERIAKSGVTLRVTEPHAVSRESPLAVTLAQGISSGERMDYTVQKAVELGVAAIQPLATERSVVRLSGERAVKRVAHWHGIAVAACEQSGRNAVPSVHPIASVAAWLAQAPPDVLKLTLSPGAASTLHELERPQCAVVLLVGPEGGLSPREQDDARAAGFTALRLGPRVLRTETAALAALAAMQALWGDF
jgi:16S rRNA (uracil1498-N3)-methyltransferase